MRYFSLGYNYMVFYMNQRIDATSFSFSQNNKRLMRYKQSRNEELLYMKT